MENEICDVLFCLYICSRRSERRTKSVRRKTTSAMGKDVIEEEEDESRDEISPVSVVVFKIPIQIDECELLCGDVLL